MPAQRGGQKPGLDTSNKDREKVKCGDAGTFAPPQLLQLRLPRDSGDILKEPKHLGEEVVGRSSLISPSFSF